LLFSTLFIWTLYVSIIISFLNILKITLCLKNEQSLWLVLSSLHPWRAHLKCWPSRSVKREGLSKVIRMSYIHGATWEKKLCQHVKTYWNRRINKWDALHQWMWSISRRCLFIFPIVILDVCLIKLLHLYWKE
jgi:hypothetical protein